MESENKKITIDDLARMVQEGFSEVKEDLDSVKKTNQLILKRLEGVVYRTEFEKLEIRVKELEELFAMPAKK